jgi:hypothetical protein
MLATQSGLRTLCDTLGLLLDRRRDVRVDTYLASFKAQSPVSDATPRPSFAATAAAFQSVPALDRPSIDLPIAKRLRARLEGVLASRNTPALGVVDGTDSVPASPQIAPQAETRAALAVRAAMAAVDASEARRTSGISMDLQPSKTIPLRALPVWSPPADVAAVAAARRLTFATRRMSFGFSAYADRSGLESLTQALRAASTATLARALDETLRVRRPPAWECPALTCLV